jgi:hypothetical protein
MFAATEAQFGPLVRPHHNGGAFDDAAFGQPQQPKKVTLTNVSGRLGQALNLGCHGITSMQMRDAHLMRSWIWKAANMQILSNMLRQHPNPEESPLKRLVLEMSMALGPNLRQQGLHTLRTLEVGTALDYLHFSALAVLPSLVTLKVSRWGNV